MSTENQSRQIAKRAFARELELSEHTYKEGDSQYSPLFTLLPSGEKASRVFVCGALTELESRANDSGGWTAKVSDGSGAPFLVWASGQYDKEGSANLKYIKDNYDIPQFVAVTGKLRVWEPEDSDDKVTFIKPESVNVISEDARDKWVTETAEMTLNRLEDEEAFNELLEVVDLEDEVVDEWLGTPDRVEDLREAVTSSLEVVA